MGGLVDVAMSVFPTGELIMGWSVPEGELHGFLARVDAAAKAAGAVPFVEADMSDEAVVTGSMARRESMDCGLVEQAERIMREG